MRGAAYLTGAARRAGGRRRRHVDRRRRAGERLPARVERRRRDRRHAHELPHARPGARSPSAAAASSQTASRRRGRAAPASATGCASEALVFGGATADADRRRRRRRPRWSWATAARRSPAATQLAAGDATRRRACWPTPSTASRPPAATARWWWSAAAAVLVPDRLPGVSEVVRPDHHDVANADRRRHRRRLAGRSTASSSPAATAAARCSTRLATRPAPRPISAGADPQTVEIVELEEVPLAYLTDPRRACPRKGGRPAPIAVKEEAVSIRYAKHRRRGLRAAALAAALVLVASACGGTSKPAGASSSGQVVEDVHLRRVHAGDGRLGSLDLLLERDHRDEQHVRDADPLQQPDREGRSRCSPPPGRSRHGRQDVDVHDPPGRQVPRPAGR